MKKILNLEGVKQINKNVQKQIKGGFFVSTFCEPSNPTVCCYSIPNTGNLHCGRASYCSYDGRCDMA